MILAIILFIVGLVALLIGARFLVGGASGLAKSFGVSSLIIGLTIVSFGTSAPEIGVSVAAAWKGEGGLVVGNIVGSNIFNVLLVLGVVAVITPIVIKKQLIRWDVPLMIGASLLFWLFAANKKIGRFEGSILLIGIVFYLIFAFKWLKKQPPEEEKNSSSRIPIWGQIIFCLLGLLLLALGSDLLVTNAIKITHYFKISELFIGLTIVAISTSLPELATSLIALKKGERDIAVGNVIGSNIFNLLGVMGIAALISPQPIVVPEKAYFFDIPVMVGVGIAVFPIVLTGHLISRWEGVLFLFYYALYLAFLFIEARFPLFLPYFTSAVLFFILPLTILTLIIGVVRHFKSRSNHNR